MYKLVTTAALACLIGFSSNLVLANEMDANSMDQTAMQKQMTVNKRQYLFEERAGTWKATCDQMEEGHVFCRTFHIEQFGEWKTKNFVQIGPAWTPDTVGFVVATYLGFKEGTKVTIGIDMNKRHEITAPKGNNLMIRPEIAKKILEEMASGNKIVVTFNSYSGVRHLSLADLDGFKTLLAKVIDQMEVNTQVKRAK